MPREADDRSSKDDRASLRRAAVHIVQKLVAAGHIAYFAGGCVRDRLMGIEPADYDVATDARPEQVAKVFPRVQTVGESFGVMLVRTKGFVIEVATFRTEGIYSDGRHPDGVEFTDAKHDASRRDFTINGLFEDPLKGEVIDYVGGRADLEARVIRAIGDPHARLREDRLRTLRAIRFAARFRFDIDEETADAIRACAGELKGVSRERIGQELQRMLTDSNRANAAWEMQYLGLDAPVLLEPSQQVAPTRLARLPDDVHYSTALAAWLLDRHGESGEDLHAIASRWADALMLSNDDRFGLQTCIERYQVLTGTWERLGVAKQKRLAAAPGFNDALQVLQATDRQVFVDVRRRVIDLAQTGLAPEPLIDGEDLIEMGLAPGPIFSRVLDAVYDAQLEGAVRDKVAAVSLARAVAMAPPPG